MIKLLWGENHFIKLVSGEHVKLQEVGPIGEVGGLWRYECMIIKLFTPTNVLTLWL